jgi:hypothetical protein
MYKEITARRFFLSLLYLIILIITGWNTYYSLTLVRGWVSPKLILYGIIYGLGLSLLLLMGLFVNFFPDRTEWISKSLRSLRCEHAAFFRAFGTVSLLIPSALVFATEIFSLKTPNGAPVKFLMMRILVFILFNILTGFLWTDSNKDLIAIFPATISFLVSGAVFILIDNFQHVTAYPFSLTWSEGNRFWDYSLRFGRDRYLHPSGEKIRALIDPGRQTLWGLPFLLPGLPIWGMRLWNAFLFTFPYAILGWFLSQKPVHNRKVWFFAGLWTMLFLYQGPIYTPLVLAAILVIGARYFPLWLGACLIALAGYYAQMSRFTWLFAPSMWAGMWSLIKARTDDRGVLSKKVWIRSLTYVGAGLVGGYILPSILKSKPAVGVERVTTAVSHHPLIWSRLWPNATYPPGIVFGLLLAVLPLTLILHRYHRMGKWKTNIWQRMALVGGLLAFLIVGIIVSVKIGGGSNLHNLDMLLIALVFVAAAVWEQGGHIEWFSNNGSSWQHIFILLAVILPIWRPLFTALPQELPSREVVQSALQNVRKQVSIAKEDGEVLFMDQRQLLTFGYVAQVPLVDEYEKKQVMNKALGGNEQYFTEFYQDLSSKRFSLIITEPLKTFMYEADKRNFAEENNAWVVFVAEPMLCFYQVQNTHHEVGVELLVPRETPCEKDSQYLQ